MRCKSHGLQLARSGNTNLRALVQEILPYLRPFYIVDKSERSVHFWVDMHRIILACLQIIPLGIASVFEHVMYSRNEKNDG